MGCGVDAISRALATSKIHWKQVTHSWIIYKGFVDGKDRYRVCYNKMYAKATIEAWCLPLSFVGTFKTKELALKACTDHHTYQGHL